MIAPGFKFFYFKTLIEDAVLKHSLSPGATSDIRVFLFSKITKI